MSIWDRTSYKRLTCYICGHIAIVRTGFPLKHLYGRNTFFWTDKIIGSTTSNNTMGKFVWFALKRARRPTYRDRYELVSTCQNDREYILCYSRCLAGSSELRDKRRTDTRKFPLMIPTFSPYTFHGSFQPLTFTVGCFIAFPEFDFHVARLIGQFCIYSHHKFRTKSAELADTDKPRLEQLKRHLLTSVKWSENEFEITYNIFHFLLAHFNSDINTGVHQWVFSIYQRQPAVTKVVDATTCHTCGSQNRFHTFPCST